MNSTRLGRSVSVVPRHVGDARLAAPALGDVLVVATQPPLAIGRLSTCTKRPSLASTTQANGWPWATLSRIRSTYGSTSPVKKPLCLRYTISSRSVQPGRTAAGER
jgi:hypothetical protein